MNELIEKMIDKLVDKNILCCSICIDAVPQNKVFVTLFFTILICIIQIITSIREGGIIIAKIYELLSDAGVYQPS